MRFASTFPPLVNLLENGPWGWRLQERGRGRSPRLQHNCRMPPSPAVVEKCKRAEWTVDSSADLSQCSFRSTRAIDSSKERRRELRVASGASTTLLQLTSRRRWSRRAPSTLHERWENCRTHSKPSFRVASLCLTHLYTTQHVHSPFFTAARRRCLHKPRLSMPRRWHNHLIWPPPVSLIYTTLHPSGTWRESPNPPAIRDIVGHWSIVRPFR